LPKGFQWILLATGLGAAFFCYAYSVFFVGAHWSATYTACVSLGGALVLLSFLVRLIPFSLTTFLASALYTLLILLPTLAAVGRDPFHALENLRLRLFPPKVGIWGFDETFGFSHIPGSQGVHTTSAYEVTYTIDDKGFRVTPTPENPKGRIVCLGCSFTFGTGVEDWECYPYFLATRYWTEYKVRNRGATAYGTAHAYLGLLEELKEEELPKLVLYGWIHLHKHRNYIRKGWVAHLENPWTEFEQPLNINDYRKHPHFEIENDRLAFKGVVGVDDLDEDPPDLKEKEVEISRRLIEEMVRVSREKGVPFVVVILPVPDDFPHDLPDYLTEALQSSGACWIDAREANRGFVAGDWHPNPETHAAIADFIAGATTVKEILFKD